MIQGKNITLIDAAIEDRLAVYEWCFHAETTKCHFGPPDFPDMKLPSYDEFRADYEDYFFDGSRLEDGRGYLITYEGEAIGFISYTAFHLKDGIAELDSWIPLEANCGKGYGNDAIITLSDYLHKKQGINTVIMAPHVKNLRAVRAYEKAGFVQSNIPMSDFLLDEFIELYGDGDYGKGNTVVCVKTF